MKRFVKLISLSVLSIFLCFLVHSSEPDDSLTVRELLDRIKYHTVERGPSWPFDMAAEPVPIPRKPGPVNLRVTISPNIECDEITVSITDIDNLEYSGQASWTVRAGIHDTLTYDLALTIPANDTSGLRIMAGCGKTRHAIPAYFISTDNSVRYYFGNPR
jgi:hypothetical protein